MAQLRKSQEVSPIGESSSQISTAEERPKRWPVFLSGPGWSLTGILAALVLSLLAQLALEPPDRSSTAGTILYLSAAVFLTWSYSRGEWVLAGTPTVGQKTASWSFRWRGFWACIPLSLLAFHLFKDNLFTTFNLLLWLLAFLAYLHAFWRPHTQMKARDSWKNFSGRAIALSPWILSVLTVFLISAFYRLHLLDLVPLEMYSDHAEKLLDVNDVLNGQTSVFFPRNTGREGFQMYLTAAVALVFDTGLSFLSLKLGTAFCGLFTLPFIYLLGKETANKRAGLLAMFFAGIAYWPNVISRVALRYTLYPTFTAPALYFLVRGLRRRSRNDFILSGIFLGLGLHGYSAFRFVPIVLVVGVVLYLLHRESKGSRKEAIWGLSLLTCSSLIIFLPLLRYVISNPTMFSHRMLTRLGQAERLFPDEPLAIFFKNLWKALTMLVWDNGGIWAHSIPFRPALGMVAAAFFVIGIVLLALRYLRDRSWLDIFLLVSIPLLLMPSVLSLAFPDENPSLNRTGGALVVVFLIVGMAFDALLTALESNRFRPFGTWLAWGLGSVLLTLSAVQNHHLVFDQYAQQSIGWNTSELGAVIHDFADSSGAEDSAWVVIFPHWVDTRLVGIKAGFPDRDYALEREDINQTLADPRAKIYLFKPEDAETLHLLQQFYPAGTLRLHESQVEGRDFYVYSVSARE